MATSMRRREQVSLGNLKRNAFGLYQRNLLSMLREFFRNDDFLHRCEGAAPPTGCFRANGCGQIPRLKPSPARMG